MTSPRYPIPAQTTRIETRVANSRFVATIGEAGSVELAKAFIAAIRAEMQDATHHVYAFRVGYGGSVTEGMSDDGEPPRTAGRPALTVLRGADIGDVALVISRYFGGTKLGTGGLVRAYTEAAQRAVESLPRAERVERRRGMVNIPYSLYERVKKLVAECGGAVAGESFGANIDLELEFAVDQISHFEADLTQLTAGGVAVRWQDD